MPVPTGNDPGTVVAIPQPPVIQSPSHSPAAVLSYSPLPLHPHLPQFLPGLPMAVGLPARSPCVFSPERSPYTFSLGRPLYSTTPFQFSAHLQLLSQYLEAQYPPQYPPHMMPSPTGSLNSTQSILLFTTGYAMEILKETMQAMQNIVE